MSRADYQTMQQMPTLEMALAFMQLVRSQRDEEEARRRHVVTEADLGQATTSGSTALEYLDGFYRARWAEGAGGGRKTPKREIAE